MMGRILVIRGGALGDFVLTLPVLAALREHFPDARLEVLGYPHIARLALAGGLAHAVHAIEARPLAGFFARKGSLDPACAAFFHGFAVIVSYLYDPDGIFQENVARCSPAQFIIGRHRPDEAGSLHAVETFLEPLQRLAIFGNDRSPRLAFHPARVAAPGPPTLALHPGSGSETKNWPEPRWAELLHLLVTRRDWHLLLVGGEAEGDRLERLGGLLPAGRHSQARSLPLDDLAARLERCDAFIGHDSGITHLAAAVGLPGLALWGPSNQAIWRPRSPRFQVLSAEQGLAQLEAARVLEALDALVDAEPRKEAPR